MVHGVRNSITGLEGPACQVRQLPLPWRERPANRQVGRVKGPLGVRAFGPQMGTPDVRPPRIPPSFG